MVKPKNDATFYQLNKEEVHAELSHDVQSLSFRAS